MLRHAILAPILVFVSFSPLFAAKAQPLPSMDQARTFRLKMIADYGPATWDDLVLARQCQRCGAVVGRQTILPGQTRPRTPADWLKRVQDVASRTVLHRRCPSCGATPAGPGFRTFLFSGMVFLEGGGDLQMTVDAAPGRAPAVQLALAKTDGGVKVLPWPIEAEKFREMTGAPLSVREEWRDLIDENGEASHPVSRKVEDGYYLVFAPPAESDGMQKEVVELLERLTKEAGALHLEALRDLEEQKRPIKKDTYHDWLKEYAQAIQEGDATAIAAVSPVAFMKVLAREAEAMGVAVALPKGRETDVVLSRGAISLKVPCSGPLIRAVHLGQSFEQGVVPLLEEVNRVRAMVRLQRRVAELVAGRYSTEVFEGTRLRFKPLKGQTGATPELDLQSLATKVDLSDERKTGGDRLGLLIGWESNAGQFREPAPPGPKCQCGRPTSAGLKVRPEKFAPPERMLQKTEGGAMIAACIECPDHIRYLKPGEVHATFDEARKAFAAAAPGLLFPITGVGLIPYKGESLPYGIGQDLPTAALDAGLTAQLLSTLQSHFQGRASTPPLAKLPGAKRAVSVYAPFQHAVVLSATPIPAADRAEVARLVREALESPFGKVDPGAPMDFTRDLTLDQPPRGRFERRTQ